MRKKLLMTVLAGSILFSPLSTFGFDTIGVSTGAITGWGFLMDAGTAIIELANLALAYTRKDTKIKADKVTNYLKENIGAFQDQGKCGRSATGATGCDLTTPEQGAQEDAEMERKLKQFLNLRSVC